MKNKQLCSCCGRWGIYLEDLCAQCAAPWWGMWGHVSKEELCSRCFIQELAVLEDD